MKQMMVILVLYILRKFRLSRVRILLPHFSRRATHCRIIFLSVPDALAMLPSASSSVSLAFAS